METLWVDFQNNNKDGVRLICNGTLKELHDKGITLKEGLQFLIWSEDEDDNGIEDKLMVEAIVRYNEKEKCWIAQYDEQALKHESDRNGTK